MMQTSLLDSLTPGDIRQLTELGIRLKPSYHVRGLIHGQAVAAAAEIANGERKASKQDAAVLGLYRSENRPLSPSQAWSCGTSRGFFKSTPITSIRRSITNLTDRGYLRMTSERVRGPWGAMEHVWALSGVAKGGGA